MNDILKFTEAASKEDKLQAIADNLEELKDVLADVIDEYETDDEEKADVLTEALDDLEAAYDSIHEVILDEL